MKILGLDISSDVVTSIEMDSAFGRFEIRDTHESPVGPNDPHSVAQALVRGLARKPDKIVTSVPMEISTFRNLQLASKDKNAIRSAIDFELEDDLPFEKDNLHYDSVILNSIPGSANIGSVVHVGAVKKVSFENHLQQLTAAGLDPDIITTDAWIYRTLFNRLESTSPSQEPILLLGFERNKTFFYVHDKNHPVLYREFSFGIHQLEFGLQERLNANPSDLKKWIQDIGLTGIEEKVSDAISDLLEVLVPEIKQTELAARASLKTSIAQIKVTGEGALMPGFLNWLEKAVSKPVSLFRPLSQISPGQVAYSDLSEIRHAKALALAISVIPLDKLGPINLRKGVFSKVSASAASTLEILKKTVPYVLMTSFIFFGVKLVEYNYYNSRLSETNDTLKKSIRIYFNTNSDSAIRNYMSNADRLKKTIKDDLNQQKALSALFSQNANSPLDFLKNISSKIGKDIVVEMNHIELGNTKEVAPYQEKSPLKASLSFIVNNAQVMAKLSDALEKYFNFKKGPSEEITQEGRKLLKVQYSGTIGDRK